MDCISSATPKMGLQPSVVRIRWTDCACSRGALLDFPSEVCFDIQEIPDATVVRIEACVHDLTVLALAGGVRARNMVGAHRKSFPGHVE